MTERRLAAWEARLEVELELGEHASIAADLQGSVEEHPFRERLHALHMLALYRLGRQGAALTVYEQVRQVLAAELGIDPGPDLAELHTAMLKADPSLHPPGVRQPAAVPELVRSHPGQLPADTADFTGRAELLADVTACLSGAGQSAYTLVAISGMGGIGKTTLAVRAAHAVRHLFPDGQLYVDLRGAQADPLVPAEVLGGFIVALGGSLESAPEGEDERAALYRSLTADQRLLVVLDNARDLDQIRGLLPGAATCATLVTSRSMPARLPSAHHVALDVLTEQEAMDLLAAIIGPERVAAERQDARRLIADCGSLPLAIHIAAARLLARPSWTLAHLVERLCGLNGFRSDDLAASFGLSRAQLTGCEHAAFRLLVACEADELSVSDCAAVLALPEPEAEELAERLVDLALLTSPMPGRYRFQHLVRLYARQLSPVAELGRL